LKLPTGALILNEKLDCKNANMFVFDASRIVVERSFGHYAKQLVTVCMYMM